MRIRAVIALCALSQVLAFSAEDMLAAPRPQPPIASPNGLDSITLVDRWDPKQDNLPLDSSIGPNELFETTPGEIGDLFWVSNEAVVYLNDSSLYLLHTESKKRTYLFDFPAGINPSGLQYDQHSNTVVFSAQVWSESGDFEDVEKLNSKYDHRGNTAQVYDELFIRHWDTWRVPGRVWTIGAVHLDKPKFINLLNNTGYYHQMDPISFTVSHSNVAFAIKAPKLNMATHTREDVYLIRDNKITHLTPHAHGAISGLKFSSRGDKLAWLEMAEDGYESDKREVVVMDITKSSSQERWTEEWDRSPSEIIWSRDDSLYLLSEDQGKVLPYHLAHANGTPKPLYNNGSTSSLTVFNDKVLIHASSLRGPGESYIIDLEGKGKEHNVTQLTHWFEPLATEIEEFWYEGVDGYQVMAWVLKPKGWKKDDGKKYPLAFLIHGGPQGAWEDAWSTRWNPAIYADEGYFVVAPNPTGSTGYGQEFCDRIKGEWGNRPFKDLLIGYQAALKHYPEIDGDRTAALGASFGGYMINWIQGHNDQFGFKCLVCHDGIFNTVDSFFSTEEIWFPQREFYGSPVDNRLLYEKWNPMNHIAEWSTPELVIHGGKDYRLADASQGITVFSALQYQGVPSRLLYFPDENHWVLKASNSRKWHYEVLRWLDEWVGDKKFDRDSPERYENGSETAFVIQD